MVHFHLLTTMFSESPELNFVIPELTDTITQLVQCTNRFESIQLVHLQARPYTTPIQFFKNVNKRTAS